MKIPYLNYSAIVLLLSLVLIIVSKIKNAFTKSTLLFLVTLVVNIFSATFSSIYLHYDNLGPGNIIQKYIFHSLYLFFHNVSGVTYFFYLISFTDDWEHFFKSKLKTISLFLPIGIVTILIIVNLFTPILFYLNENDAYTRLWKTFFFLYASTGFYLIYSISYLFKNKNLYTKKQFLTTAVVFPILVLSFILELLTKQLVVESFFDAIAILFVTINIQRSEETVCTETGFFNGATYNLDTKKIIVNQKNVIQIIINITNFDTVQKMVGYKNRSKLLKILTKYIITEEKKLKIKPVNYYIGDGCYRLIFNIKKADKVTVLAENINRFFNTTLEFQNIYLNLITIVCIQKNPTDISDYDMIQIFGKQINDPQYFTGNVLYTHNLYTDDYYQKLRNIDSILEEALSKRKFKVYYQPIYSIKDKKFCSAEALLRLKDEVYGNITPEMFIATAEQNGLIYKITDYLLEDVCKFIASEEFSKLGLDYIEINLSAAECMQDNLPQRILAILNSHNLSPGKIVIEITETAFALSEKQLQKNMEKLVTGGIKISLDNFGSGYSNLQRLTYIPLHTVKFDKSFINEINDDRIRHIMLCNMGKMIHEMDIKFLIEGVESKEVLNYFEELGVDYVQGFYFSKPIPKDEFISFLCKESKRKNRN